MDLFTWIIALAGLAAWEGLSQWRRRRRLRNLRQEPRS